jgi:hypothetical protein
VNLLATNCLGDGHFSMSQRPPSLPCFSASLRGIRGLGSPHQHSISPKRTLPLWLVPSTCLASFCPSSALTRFLPTKRHQPRSEVSMTRLHDWDYEVKPARTMCHGKSGLDPPSPSMSQAGRVKPVERERRSPQSDRKRNSLASFRTHKCERT